jgi:hypothetical protein
MLLPIMAPRLQADCRPDGMVDLALWGCGKLAKVSFTPLAGPLHLWPQPHPGSARRRLRCPVCARDADTWRSPPPGHAGTAFRLVARGAGGRAARCRDAPRRRAARWSFPGAPSSSSSALTTSCSLGGRRCTRPVRALRLDAADIIAEADGVRGALRPDARCRPGVCAAWSSTAVHAALSSIRRETPAGSFAGPRSRPSLQRAGADLLSRRLLDDTSSLRACAGVR